MGGGLGSARGRAAQPAGRVAPDWLDVTVLAPRLASRVQVEYLERDSGAQGREGGRRVLPHLRIFS